MSILRKTELKSSMGWGFRKMQNYYKTLNISPTANDADLKKALHEALRLWSNRTNAPQIDRRQEAERMVKLIEEAETILLNPAKRAEYDRQLKSSPPPVPSASPTDRAALDSAQDLVAEGRKLLAEGNIGDTLYVATKATERDGGNPEAWALLGRARFLFGDVEDAIYEYKRAIKLKPNEGVYYSELGDIYNDTDKLDDALTQYKRAAQVEPAEPWYRAQVAHVLRKQDNTAEAVQILEECVKEKPDVPAFRFELAAAYINSSRDCCTFDSETGNFFPTSKAQVLASLEFIHKAEKLNVDDLKEDIQKNKKALKESIKRKYDGSTGAAVVGGIIWFCAYGLGLIFLPFYFYASRPPKYAIYKRAIRQEGTGSQKTFQAAGKVADVIGANENVRGGIGLAVLIGTGLFLPIMAIVNYVKNYTGENDTKNINLDADSSSKENKASSEIPTVLPTIENPTSVVTQDVTPTVSSPVTQSSPHPKVIITIPTEFFKKKPFFIGTVTLIAICVIFFLFSIISHGTALSYKLSLDGNELPLIQTSEVQVDGRPFNSGDHLKPGPHKISVQLADAEPYEKHFWVFYGTRDLGNLPLETSKGSLSVTASPSPSSITVKHDLQTVAEGQSPLAVDKLPVGRYALIITHGDCLETRIVEVQRGQKTETNVVLNLGVADLSAEPADAEFVLSGNGKHWQGALPASIIDMPAGDYALAVTRNGWELDSSVSIIRGGVTTNQTEFPYGSIEVASAPSGLAVSTNGVEIGKTPVTIQGLRPAQYAITVSDGENDLMADVNVAPKEKARHAFVFRYGSVQLSSTPAGAVVIRKGKGIGKTPLKLDHIPAGQTTVELRLQDYATTNLMLDAVEGVTTDVAVKLFNAEYVQAMNKAHGALAAGQFADAQAAITAALAIEANDAAALELSNEVVQAVSKATEAAKAAQENAKAQMLAALQWLDFHQMVSDCTDTKEVQYPVEMNDGYYEDYIDMSGKKRQRFVVTGHHTEMQTRTESNFSPKKFAEGYENKTFGFNCSGNWSISKVEDGNVMFRQARGLLGADNIIASPPPSNPDALKSLQRGQKARIKGIVTKYNPGPFVQILYLENVEILN